MKRYDEPEGALLEQGEWHAAAELNADFWLSEAAGPELRARALEMQERAFELQSESEAEESEPDRIDLGGVRARTLVVVGELDKADFHAIGDRLEREIDGAQGARVERAGHLPSLENPGVTRGLCATSCAGSLSADASAQASSPNPLAASGRRLGALIRARFT